MLRPESKQVVVDNTPLDTLDDGWNRLHCMVHEPPSPFRLFGNPVKVDIDRTDLAAAAAADTGVLATQCPETETLVFHAETQAIGAAWPEIVISSDLAVFSEETVVPDAMPGHATVQLRLHRACQSSSRSDRPRNRPRRKDSAAPPRPRRQHRSAAAKRSSASSAPAFPTTLGPWQRTCLAKFGNRWHATAPRLQERGPRPVPGRKQITGQGHQLSSRSGIPDPAHTPSPPAEICARRAWYGSSSAKTWSRYQTACKSQSVSPTTAKDPSTRGATNRPAE